MTLLRCFMNGGLIVSPTPGKMLRTSLSLSVVFMPSSILSLIVLYCVFSTSSVISGNRTFIKPINRPQTSLIRRHDEIKKFQLNFMCLEFLKLGCEAHNARGVKSR